MLPVLPGSGCSAKEYVIAEEAAVLQRMRAIRAEADPLRRKLGTMAQEESSPRRRAVEAEIAALRERFRLAQEDLKAATRLKMIRLGHITER